MTRTLEYAGCSCDQCPRPTSPPVRALAFGPPALPSSTRARAWRWRFAILVVAAAPRVWAALWDRGISWPDEVVQTLEPAHHFAFGWGLVAQEFKEGIRSWLLPIVLGLLWRLASALGVHTGVALVGIAKLGMAALSLTGVWLTMSLALRLRGQRAAILAGLLAAACAPLVAFGSRGFVETASVPCIIGAALLLETRGQRHAAFAGILATLAIFLRYPNVLLWAGLLILLLARRRRDDAKAYVVAALVAAIPLGLLDWPTGGWPFRSLWNDVKLHILDSHGWNENREPFAYYFEHLKSSMGVSFGIVLVGLALAWRRARGLVTFVVLAVVVTSLIPQKDLRYLLPMLPVALAVAAVGLSRLIDGLQGGAAPTYVLGILCALQMGFLTQTVTRGQLGQGASDLVIWHSGEDYFQAVAEASKAPDLCGAVLTGNDPAWTGGYSFLHRPAPIYFDTHAEHLASANFVVGAPTERLPPGWSRTYLNGRYALWRRSGGCDTPPHGWNMNLP
jgi:GPI mannosyltransferase 3